MILPLCGLAEIMHYERVLTSRLKLRLNKSAANCSCSLHTIRTPGRCAVAARLPVQKRKKNFSAASRPKETATARGGRSDLGVGWPEPGGRVPTPNRPPATAMPKPNDKQLIKHSPLQIHLNFHIL